MTDLNQERIEFLNKTIEAVDRIEGELIDFEIEGRIDFSPFLVSENEGVLSTEQPINLVKRELADAYSEAIAAVKNLYRALETYKDKRQFHLQDDLNPKPVVQIEVE